MPPRPCSFHHRLVHEHGWRMRRLPTGELARYRPDGTRHVPGPVLRGLEVDGVSEPVVFGPFEQDVAGPHAAPHGQEPDQARDGPDP